MMLILSFKVALFFLLEWYCFDKIIRLDPSIVKEGFILAKADRTPSFSN